MLIVQLKAPITVKLFKLSNFANLLNLKVYILESVIRIARPVITFPRNIKHNFFEMTIYLKVLLVLQDLNNVFSHYGTQLAFLLIRLLIFAKK